MIRVKIISTVLCYIAYQLQFFNTAGSIGPGVKNKEKVKSKCGIAKRSGSSCRVNDSWNSAALERWIVTDRRWKMNDPSRLSPDTSPYHAAKVFKEMVHRVVHWALSPRSPWQLEGKWMLKGCRHFAQSKHIHMSSSCRWTGDCKLSFCCVFCMFFLNLS